MTKPAHQPAHQGVEILRTIDTDRIRDLRDRGAFFWLDLEERPSDADLKRLGELVTIHPLALEDTREFGQRAKFDDYPNSALLVFYGVEPQLEHRPHLVEVHLHISSQALVTVPSESLTALTAARHRVAADPTAHGGHAVYRVLDALADSFLDVLDPFDDTIDKLQDALVEHATTAHRHRIFELRRQLAELRQVVLPQRDMLASGDDIIDVIPDSERSNARDRFRDVHDHLTRAGGLIGTYREQLGSLLDLYLTETSNRLNETMKRLTLIATVFLPLTFLTAFFGMNFGWLTQVITPLWTFIVFGIVLMIGSAVATAVYLRRAS